MEEIANLPNRGLRVSVMFNDVTITIRADNEYEAQVLFEDLAARLRDGQSIKIEAANFKRDKA